MMREYLFRGRRRDNREWVFGSCYKQTEFYGDKVEGIMIITSSESLCYDQALEYYAVSEETVGQFTGLIVKEKQWFEHDIISVRDEGEEIYRFVIAFGVCGGVRNVKHTVGYMGFHFIPANEETRRCMDAGARNDPLYWLNAYDCEVIGNIHDNPELLKGA